MGDLEAPSAFPLKFETCSSFISVGKPSLDLGLNSSNENLIAEVFFPFLSLCGYENDHTHTGVATEELLGVSFLSQPLVHPSHFFMGGLDDGRYKCKNECECKTEVSLTGTLHILLLPQKSADHRVFSQITLMTDELISFTLPHARRWTLRWLQPSATQALSRVQAVSPMRWRGGAPGVLMGLVACDHGACSP